MKFNILPVVILTLLVSCNQTNNTADKKEVVSTIAAGGQEDEEFLKRNRAEIEAEEKALEELKKNTTSFTVDHEVHDFGKVKMGSENLCEFKITNTGQSPLIINNVTASCGCTTPKKPEKPIPPGKSDIIKVGYKPNNQGTNEKTVTIESNSEPRLRTVKVKAEVY